MAKKYGQSQSVVNPRSTRSQSREAEVTRKSRGKAIRNDADLAPVEEVGDEHDADEDVDEDVDADGDEDEEMPSRPNFAPTASMYTHHSRRASAFSGISGTTAKTSFSQEEISELDPDIMVDVFSNLSSAADQLANLLVPSDPQAHPLIRKEIRTLNTKANKLYQNRIQAIRLHKGSFGSTAYVQPTIVLRALLGLHNMNDVPDAPWRPDNVIYKFNLAVMLNTVLITLSSETRADDEGYNALEALDANFCDAIAGPTTTDGAFDICLAIVVQLCLLRLTWYLPDPTFDPKDIIEKAFYSQDDDGTLVFRHERALKLLDMDDHTRAERVRRITKTATSFANAFVRRNRATWDAVVNQLKAQHPWESFVDDVVAYHLTRKQELEDQIIAQGGIDQIMAGLTEEVERQADKRTADGLRLSLSRKGTAVKKTVGKSGIKAFKERKKQLELEANAAAVLPAAPATAPVPAALPMIAPPVKAAAPPATAPVSKATIPATTEADAPLDDEWRPLQDDDDYTTALNPDEASIPISHAVQKRLPSYQLAAIANFHTGQKQKPDKGKRKWIDHQPGAQRVSFEDSDTQASQQTGRATFRLPSSSTGDHVLNNQTQRSNNKRPITEVDANQDIEDEEWNPTQDQAFETDTRDAAAADLRRQKAPQSSSQTRRSPSSSEQSAAPGPSTARRTPSGSPMRKRRNPGSSIPALASRPDHENFVPPTATASLELARVAARNNTIAKPKVARARVNWTTDEEVRLIELIEGMEGTDVPWAILKRIDQETEGRLDRRTQEDMRLKARNLKETFLRAYAALPRNFEHVVLDKKAIDKLHNMGIEYEQARIRGVGRELMEV